MDQKTITRLEDFADIDVEAIAQAFEADAGESLPGLREALGEAKRGEFGRVTTPAQMLIREARSLTGMSQDEFALSIDTPVATLRGWEQGRFAPPGAVLALARLIIKNPQSAKDLVSA
jgi:putative transcriptional regulator